MLRKKIRNFSLKTPEFKKKNKKKIGSNDEILRTVEPQQKQRVLIKKKGVRYRILGEYQTAKYDRFAQVSCGSYKRPVANIKTQQTFFKVVLKSIPYANLKLLSSGSS